MKAILSLSLLLFFSLALQAQSPAADPDTLKNPIKQIDPELKNEPADIHYVDEMTRITAEELPAVVLDSLKTIEPAAWEKSVVYRHKKNDLFIVEVRDGGRETTYRFNKEGRRLKNLDDEQQE